MGAVPDARATVEAQVTGAATGLAAAFTARAGTVEAFDDHVGAGVVRDVGTGETWSFHCTRILGGTRTVPVGAAVTFRVEPGPVGLEAVAIATA